MEGKCEFCGEPVHDTAVEILANLFKMIAADEGKSDAWIAERAHYAWRDTRRAGKVTISTDGRTLVMWLSALRAD